MIYFLLADNFQCVRRDNVGKYFSKQFRDFPFKNSVNIEVTQLY